MTSTTLPAVRGACLAVFAASLFGLSTPLVQRFGVGLGAFTTAALLYAGAALVGALSQRDIKREASVDRSDVPRLLAIALFGAVIGPVALAWGLQRTSGTGASLLLTLEALFTAAFAWRLYGEAMGRRVWAAMLLLLAGGVILLLDRGRIGETQLWGMFAVLLATAAWGMDNTLSRPLALRDPSQVVMLKALLGTVATASIALLLGEALPSWRAALGLLLVGASGYGLSLRFYLLAQRAFGAARTGSVFALAPFIGAIAALALGDSSASATMMLGGALMLLGVLLHLAESHDHEHLHDELTHEHAHRHDDDHHTHAHPGTADGDQSEHSHLHTHQPMRHGHAHVPDAHHGHRH